MDSLFVEVFYVCFVLKVLLVCACRCLRCSFCLALKVVVSGGSKIFGRCFIWFCLNFVFVFIVGLTRGPFGDRRFFLDFLCANLRWSGWEMVCWVICCLAPPKGGLR